MFDANGGSILTVSDVSVHFGGLLALDRVTFNVARGSRHGILGPNGAGKTTLFNVITGFVSTQAGIVRLNRNDISALSPHRRARLGLVRTFQITTLFKDLTVLENALLGALVRLGHHRNVLRAAREDSQAIALAYEQLEQLHLDHLADMPVQQVSYGEQRQLEIAVSLALDPQVLLLDEPTAGLSSAETHAVIDLIRNLPQSLTVVIIEHDLEVVFQLADHLTVLHYGRRIADGLTQEVREDPVVREVYLGTD